MRGLTLLTLAFAASIAPEADARPSRSPPIAPIAEALGVRAEQGVILDLHQREIAHRAGSRLLSLCPDCRLGTIDEEGPCGWARVNRAIIKNAVAAGHNEEAIVHAYVATYGEQILAVDTDRGWAAMTWLVPYALIAVGLGLVAVVGVRARRRQARARAPSPGPPPAPAVRDAAYAELQEELASLD